MKRFYLFGSIILIATALFAIYLIISKESKSSDTKLSNTSGLEKTNDIKNVKEKKSCCSEEEAGDYSSNSIYNLEPDWVNQNGNKINLGSLRGKPVILTLFYASCTYACPILINDMKKIESSLPKNKLNGYKFVLVSIDPERDTPEKLLKTIKMNNLDSRRWTLLTGNKDDVMNLAALIGFKFKDDSKGGFSHSNLMTLLNENGEIIHQHVGLNQNVDDVLLVLNKFN
jgi:protein SCO1